MNSTICPNCNEKACSKLFKATGFAISVHCKNCGASLKIDERKSRNFVITSVIIILIMWRIFQVPWWVSLVIFMPISAYKQYNSPFILVYANS